MLRKSLFSSRVLPYGLALIPFLYVLALTVAYTVDVPFWDQWEFVPLLDKSYRGTLTFSDLWAQHNEHRFLFPMILMLFLARMSGWNMYYEVAVNIILAVGVFGLAVYQIRETEKASGVSWGKWIIPLISLVIFSASPWENWIWGAGMVVWLNTFTAVATIVLLSRPTFRWWRFILASLLSIISMYSWANGVVLWPIGLIILLSMIPSLRMNPLALLLWVVLGISAMGTYLYQYQQPSQHSSIWFLFNHPVEYAQYIFTYLGAPTIPQTRMSLGPLMLFGFLGFLGFTVGGVLCLRSQHMPSSGLISWISFGLYAVLSALLTGIGRAGFGPEQASSPRYITISSFMWLATMVFFYLFIKTNGTKLKKTVFGAGILVTSLLILFNSLFSGLYWMPRHHGSLLAARTGLLAPQREDAAVLQRLYDRPDAITMGVTVLKQYRLSVFRGGEP